MDGRDAPAYVVEPLFPLVGNWLPRAIGYSLSGQGLSEALKRPSLCSGSLLRAPEGAQSVLLLAVLEAEYGVFYQLKPGDAKRPQ